MKDFEKKLFFYRQLYRLFYSPERIAFPSIEKKESARKIKELSDTFEITQGSKTFLFFLSLPNLSFFKFLKLFVFSLSGLDKSILVDAKKIRALSNYFSPKSNILSLFQKEKDFFSQKINLNLPIPEVLTDEWIYSFSYLLLLPYVKKFFPELEDRFFIRFPSISADQLDLTDLLKIDQKRMTQILDFILKKNFRKFEKIIRD